MRTIFVSGPMTGYVNYNYDEFFKVAKEIEDLGFRVVNPASIGIQEGYTWKDYMKESLMMLITNDVDTVVTLEGWTKSKGARLEVHIAKELGIEVIHVNDFLKKYISLHEVQV